MAMVGTALGAAIDAEMGAAPITVPNVAKFKIGKAIGDYVGSFGTYMNYPVPTVTGVYVAPYIVTGLTDTSDQDDGLLQLATAIVNSLTGHPNTKPVIDGGPDITTAGSPSALKDLMKINVTSTNTTAGRNGLGISVVDHLQTNGWN